MIKIYSSLLARTDNFQNVFKKNENLINSSYSPHFLRNPNRPLFATELDLGRFTNDPTLSASVLSRNNVGMGLLLVNRSNLEISVINQLFKSMRDIEVNSTKKFLVISSPSNSIKEIDGWDLRDLLLITEIARKFPAEKISLENYVHGKLGNLSDFAFLVFDFYKPIIASFSGQLKNSAISLVFSLSHFSCANKDTSMIMNFSEFGFVPIGGLSFVLGNLPNFLGNFLALTGQELKGVDVLRLGLANKLMSEEAIEFMEISAEDKFGTSDELMSDLLHDHFLTEEEMNMEISNEFKEIENHIQVISDCFGFNTLDMIIEKLEEYANDKMAAKSRRNFASETLNRIRKGKPLSLHVSHELINRARRIILRNEDLQKSNEKSKRESLIEILNMELRVAFNLLTTDSSDELHNAIYKNIMNVDLGSETTMEEIKNIETSKIANLFKPLPPHLFEFTGKAIKDRSPISLSAHPRMRKFHPDYDPSTGLDYDPSLMKSELKRWDANYLKKYETRFQKLLLGEDVAYRLHSHWK